MTAFNVWRLAPSDSASLGYEYLRDLCDARTSQLLVKGKEFGYFLVGYRMK